MLPRSNLADKLLPRSERPPVEKRSKRTADKSDFSESASDSDNTTRRPGKRCRESNPLVHDLSGLASLSDELDEEDDLKKLTERPQANGQKERESSTAGTKFLQDIGNSFDDDDVTGENKYKQAENCGDVKGTKVNPEIWS